MVIVEESTPRTRVNMCLCWFDAHLIWDEVHTIDRNTIVRGDWSKTRFLYAGRPRPALLLPRQVQGLLDQPRRNQRDAGQGPDGILGAVCRPLPEHLPIDMNVVNDFEHTGRFRFPARSSTSTSLEALEPAEAQQRHRLDTPRPVRP